MATKADGAELYQLCEQCHGSAGEGSLVYSAPSIAGLDAWYVAKQLEGFKQGLRGAHPDDTTGMYMRPMALTLKSEAAVNAVANYVAALPPTPRPTKVHGDPERGRELWGTCAACHGANGEGNKATGAAPLKFSSDWYLLSQLEKFRAGVRGTSPTDTAGALMRPMALGIPDEKAMRDVVSYIAHLP